MGMLLSTSRVMAYAAGMGRRGAEVTDNTGHVLYAAKGAHPACTPPHLQ
jgi:hypothetical protein